MNQTHKLHRLFFYLTLLFLPIQLGQHFWPSWALVLGRRVDYLSPTLYLTDITMLLTIITWISEKIIDNHNLKSYFLENLIKKRPKNNTVGIVNTLSKLKTPAIIVFMFWNIYISINQSVSTLFWFKAIELWLFYIYWIKAKPNWNRILLILGIAVLYSSTIGICQFILQKSIGGLLWYLGERLFTVDSPGIARFTLCVPGIITNSIGLNPYCHETLRVYATFPHPNVFGGFLAITLPLLWISRYKQKTKFERSITSASIFMGTVALALTFSRSAITTFFIALLIIALLKAFYNQTKPSTILPSIIYFVLFIPIITFITISILPFLINNPLNESVFIRKKLAQSALSIWYAHPLFGVGLGNFLTALPKFLVVKTTYFLQPAHNTLLLIFSEIGTIGALLVIVVFWRLIAKVIIKALKDKDAQSMFLRLYPLVAIIVLGSVDHYLLTLQQGRLLIIIAIGLALR